jgi:hypothetical protein
VRTLQHNAQPFKIEHGKRAATDTNGFPNSTPTAAIIISDDMSAAAAAAAWSEAAALSAEHHASSVDISAAAAVRANAAGLRARSCFTGTTRRHGGAFGPLDDGGGGGAVL